MNHWMGIKETFPKLSYDLSLQLINLQSIQFSWSTLVNVKMVITHWLEQYFQGLNKPVIFQHKMKGYMHSFKESWAFQYLYQPLYLLWLSLLTWMQVGQHHNQNSQ